MKRLFVGLVLLLMAFLSTLRELDGFHGLLARAGVQRWVTELVLAAVAVTLFVRATSLHRRLLFPRRGVRLLLAGIALHGLGLAVASGLLARAAGQLAPEPQGAWAALPQVLPLVTALPLIAIAQVLLLAGAFRALTHLVPPDEFAQDF